MANQVLRRNSVGKLVWVDGGDVDRLADRTTGLHRPLVSDALGFGQHQYAEMEADRLANGFTDVEFVRDSQVPEFYQVKIGSRRAWQRYLRHRGFTDRNSTLGSGATLSDEMLEDAQRRVRQKYGPPRAQ